MALQFLLVAVAVTWLTFSEAEGFTESSEFHVSGRMNNSSRSRRGKKSFHFEQPQAQRGNFRLDHQ
jgi:hypothetical protein